MWAFFELLRRDFTFCQSFLGLRPRSIYVLCVLNFIYFQTQGLISGYLVVQGSKLVPSGPRQALDTLLSKVSNGNLVVNGMQKVPRGPRYTKGTQCSKMYRGYLVVQGVQRAHKIVADFLKTICSACTKIKSQQFSAKKCPKTSGKNAEISQNLFFYIYIF